MAIYDTSIMQKFKEDVLFILSVKKGVCLKIKDKKMSFKKNWDFACPPVCKAGSLKLEFGSKKNSP